jgi:S1-C subfamily serine protease
MKRRVTIPALLVAASLVSGCVESLYVEDMPPDQRAAAADVRLYENLGVPKSAYKTLGSVEGTSCQTTLYDARATLAEALTKLRLKTAQLGGNGVIQYLCSSRGPSFVPACSSSFTCAGTAIKFNTEIAERPSLGGSGTGFFINPQGDIVTNAHVTRGCSKVTVRAGEKSGEGTVAYTDNRTDLALVRTGHPAEAFLKLRMAPAVQLGESVVTAGFPLGSILSSQIHVTDGSVSSLAGARDDTRMIQITAPIQRGNSGGPLVDAAGNLVGVNTAGFDASVAQNVNFAVKTSLVATFLDSARVQYTTTSSVGTLPKTEIAARTARATVKLICDPSKGGESS